MWRRELSSGLCDDRQGGMGVRMGRKPRKEGMRVYMRLIHSAV